MFLSVALLALFFSPSPTAASDDITSRFLVVAQDGTLTMPPSWLGNHVLGAFLSSEHPFDTLQICNHHAFSVWVEGRLSTSAEGCVSVARSTFPPARTQGDWFLAVYSKVNLNTLQVILRPGEKRSAPPAAIRSRSSHSASHDFLILNALVILALFGVKKVYFSQILTGSVQDGRRTFQDGKENQEETGTFHFGSFTLAFLVASAFTFQDVQDVAGASHAQWGIGLLRIFAGVVCVIYIRHLLSHLSGRVLAVTEMGKEISRRFLRYGLFFATLHYLFCIGSYFWVQHAAMIPSMGLLYYFGVASGLLLVNLLHYVLLREHPVSKIFSYLCVTDFLFVYGLAIASMRLGH